MSGERSKNAAAPPTVALFLVRFDQRRGNVIAWFRAADDASEPTSGLEFKALPSGLHTVERDLIYFIHDGLAGISAFENAPASEADRNASFFSVGLLIPRDGSRLGKAWLYAERLRSLAANLRTQPLGVDPESENNTTGSPSVSAEVTQRLDQFFEQCQGQKGRNAVGASGMDHAPAAPPGRRRGFSESANLNMSDCHPASSFVPLLDSLGPLLFPLYRYAILGKRIILIQRPPLHTTCNYVYLMSILSSFPSTVADEIPEAPDRLEPLFNVGTYDITEIERRTDSRVGASNTDDSSFPQTNGWIACTSDELLATKSNLYDVKVEFPGSTIARDLGAHWPVMTTNQGDVIRATQRDLRRYKTLRKRIYQIMNDNSEATSTEDVHEPTPRPQPTSDTLQWSVPDERAAVEALPWAAMAYDSFMWYATAGEGSDETREETELDRDLLDACFAGRPQSPTDSRRSISSRKELDQPLELSIVSYFHRLTSSIFMTMIDAISEDDADQDPTVSRKKSVFITQSDLMHMGLDAWSRTDSHFLQELAFTYLNMSCEVQGASVQCCGVRLL